MSLSQKNNIVFFYLLKIKEFNFVSTQNNLCKITPTKKSTNNVGKYVVPSIFDKINAPNIVITMSIRAKSNNLNECTPFLGSPNTHHLCYFANF